ncbi:MAG: hypothetical protein ABL959_12560 [Pyrinomonadaceae bacterium]
MSPGAFEEKGLSPDARSRKTLTGRAPGVEWCAVLRSGTATTALRCGIAG